MEFLGAVLTNNLHHQAKRGEVCEQADFNILVDARQTMKTAATEDFWTTFSPANGLFVGTDAQQRSSQ